MPERAGILGDLIFMGIDVGTSGARAVLVDEKGWMLHEASLGFSLQNSLVGGEPGWFQQSPQMWWESLLSCISDCVLHLKAKGIAADRIKCVSVTSTSGTVIPLDSDFNPLHDAVMYNDSRSAKQAQSANVELGSLTKRLGYKFDASFGLSKMLWFKDALPGVFERTRMFAHAGDYIIGKLCSIYGVTDYTNSLKSGYDLEDLKWPEEITGRLGVSADKLPEVLPPGTPIGHISPECSAKTGLSVATAVALGMTDGCTSQIASGAASLQQWNTTIGTTLVIKGVTEKLILDPQGRIYSHRHPEGYWMPGGASNVGGDCLKNNFKPESFDELNAMIKDRGPSGMIVYPLERKGERFPLRNADATGFRKGEPADEAELYQAYLEGVGFVERLAYDVLEELGAVIGGSIYSAGGATKSKEWLKIRANIMGKEMLVPEVPGGHMGAAILAASKSYWGSLETAAKNMVRIKDSFMPDARQTSLYKEKYLEFINEMTVRGYIGGVL